MTSHDQASTPIAPTTTARSSTAPSTTARSRTALLVIDAQKSFRALPSWSSISNPGIGDSIVRLVDDARSRGDAVIWVLHAEPGSESPFDPASGSVQLLSELSAFDDEPVITKTVHNAFTTTNLHHLLTTRSIRNVVVSGIRTEQCCETTARLASDLGFHVTFVTDATATSPRPHWSLPDTATVAEIAADERTLHCADIMQRTEYALAGRFADISTIDQWTSRLR